MRKAWIAQFLLAGALVFHARTAAGQDRYPGLLQPVVLPPFDAQAPTCRAPPNLSRTLVFAQDNQRKFMQGAASGLALAAKDRGLSFHILQANNNAALMKQQVSTLIDQKIGALVAAPVDPPSLSSSLQEIIWSGAYVGTIVPPPAITLLNAPQYLTGKVLAEEAARYIQERLGGKARVVILTHDSLQFLAPRFTAMRDILRSLPGVEVVADISPLTVDEAGGAQMMRTILQAYPEIDVVLGADTVVLGALSALRDEKRARPDQFLGGIDGEPSAIVEIKKGGGPYKASVSLSSPVFAYAMGQHAADWLEGKSVPQALDILPRAINANNIEEFEKDASDPAAVYRDPIKRAAYLKMYGNICYETRQNYVNFPWSSEK